MLLNNKIISIIFINNTNILTVAKGKRFDTFCNNTNVHLLSKSQDYTIIYKSMFTFRLGKGPLITTYLRIFMGIKSVPSTLKVVKSSMTVYSQDSVHFPNQMRSNVMSIENSLLV